MGTSSSFGGSKPNSSLLPSWANVDNDINPQEETPKNGKWQGAKSALGRVVSGTSGASIGNAARSYVRGLGGAKSAARSSQKGSQAIGGFGGFLSSVSGSGFNETLAEYGLQNCIGKPAQVVFANIADKFAPSGGIPQDDYIREAILKALDCLWEKYETEGRNVDTLENLNHEDIQEAMLTAVTAFIFSRWIHETGIAIEKKMVDVSVVASTEEEARSFIKEEVRNAFSNQNMINYDYRSVQTDKNMDSIFETAYSFIEQSK